MRVAIVVLALGTVLLGVLTVGTPVAGGNTVAATTAGINLSTSPPARPTRGAAPAPVQAEPLLLALLVVLAATALAVWMTTVIAKPCRSCRWYGAAGWRAPPLTT